MILLIAIIVGVAVFCLLHGYIALAIVCLFGFSKRYGWPALLITSTFLFWHRHWFVALLPPLLIMWNIWGLKYVGAPVSSGQDIISTMKQQAASGDAAAQYGLGGLYFDGLGVLQDYAQAAFWFRKAAEQGDLGAQYKLGVLYCYGLGVPQDYAQAAAWFRKATEQADAVAQDGHGAAAFMLIALGVPHDYADAYFWLDLAAAGKLMDAEQAAKCRDIIASHLTPADLSREQERARKWFEAHQAKPQWRDPPDADQAEAWFKEGRELWRQQRPAEAAACFRPAAERGHAAAQEALGSMYAWGHGVPQDYAQAAAWWRKAAEQGDAKAQGEFGMMYAAAMGVPQDYAQAALWWRRAAEQGDAYAQGELGYLYALGKGVPRDYAQAILWLRKAAEQGLPNAQHNLGVLYRDGYGVPQDHTEAYFWFAVAAAGELGTPSAKDAAKDRDEGALHLTQADLARAQERAGKWFEDHRAKPQ